jgi:hypothetical protein
VWGGKCEQHKIERRKAVVVDRRQHVRW